MKYIVKNCPAIISLYKRHLCALTSNYYCKDCTDCVIKRVVDKCKEETKLIRIYKDNDKGTAIAEYSLSKDFAQEILDMFELEEVK